MPMPWTGTATEPDVTPEERARLEVDLAARSAFRD